MKKPIEVDLDALEELQEKRDLIVEEGSTNGTSNRIIDEDDDPLDKLPEHAIQNEDGSITLPLTPKVMVTTRKDGKVRDREYAELVFHRLNGADMRAVNATSDEMSLVVSFARSTRITTPVMTAIFDKMDAANITDGGRILNHFLTRGRKLPN